MSTVADRGDFVATPKRTHVAHAWLTGFVFVELVAEANRRQLHPDALTAKILERVICRGLIDELVDS